MRHLPSATLLLALAVAAAACGSNPATTADGGGEAPVPLADGGTAEAPLSLDDGSPEAPVPLADAMVDAPADADSVPVDPAAWQSAGNLAQGRLGHTATVLPSGDVLVVAGEEYAKPAKASVELYSFASATWTTVNDLPVQTANHTANLLGNGKVLVAGGGRSTDELFPSGQVTDAAFLFDIATRTWSPTGSLQVARSHHRAVTLKDGRVLVIGGAGASHTSGPRLADALASCELYDPNSGTWTDAAPLQSARFFHGAVLLPSGLVLVAGGANEKEQGFASTELYDPANDQWTTAAAMTIDRLWQAMAPLPSGNVLAAGGKRSNIAFLSSTEVFDRSSKAWSAAAGLPKIGNGSALTTLSSGRLLLTGGYGYFGGSFETLAQATLYDEGTNGWTSISPLATPRTLHTASLLADGRVLIIGGLGVVSDGLPGCEVSTN